MEKNDEWASYLQEICYPVERYLLGFTVRDKERLAGAIITSAFLNGTIGFDQLRKIPQDRSLETIGSYVLAFAILEQFPQKETATPQEVNDFREFHTSSLTLHWFARNHLHLQHFMLWGPGEKENGTGDQPPMKMLAERFGMLVGVIYLEKGIEAVREFLKKHHFFEEIDRLNKPG